MRIHSVHSRDIAAPAQQVGGLLDGLGDHGGVLWPTERWPTEPMAFDRGLAVGSTGGHGSTRYAVEAYEPGRSVVFRMDPRICLDGTHRFDVDALTDGHCRLSHTLDVRVAGRMWPVKPVIVAFHDAILEDFLARAENAATGAPLHYPPIPHWLRTVHRALLGIARWKGALPPEPPPLRSRHATGAVASAVLPPALLGIGALHAVWATGSSWPAGSREALAHRVVGEGASMPPDAGILGGRRTAEHQCRCGTPGGAGVTLAARSAADLDDGSRADRTRRRLPADRPRSRPRRRLRPHRHRGVLAVVSAARPRRPRGRARSARTALGCAGGRCLATQHLAPNP